MFMKQYLLHYFTGYMDTIESFCDKGTLKQLANVIRRTNIPVKVKRDFAAARDFLNVVVDAHIVGAAMQFFGMNCMTDAPNKNQDFCQTPAMNKRASILLSAWNQWSASLHYIMLSHSQRLLVRVLIVSLTMPAQSLGWG